jgi:hypothetical protein
LAVLPPPGDPDELTRARYLVRSTRFPGAPGSLERYAGELARQGAVIEEELSGDEVRSPSVQMRITPLGELEVLSTHDQLLGGEDGTTYFGCVFPADARYARAITEEAVKVGRRLGREGVIGRFAIDFLTVRKPTGGWDSYAIELNLRKGGTTHPFLTLQFLTDGAYDPDRAEFTAPNGQRKFFIASDHVGGPAYRKLRVEDLFDLVVVHGLHFDQSRQTGVVMHMMSALTEHGRMGLTAVGDSPDQAREIYDRAVSLLDAEARAAAG